MSPEKKIDATQRQRLFTWLNADRNTVLKNLVIDHRTGSACFAYVVGEEPLIIVKETSLSDELTLYFSPALTEQLEKAGIVEFPKPQKKKLLE